MEKAEFVRLCGELLNIAKPYLLKCELKLGKDIPHNCFERYIDDEDYVVITCDNEYKYVLPVQSSSLTAIACEIFTSMAHK